MKRLQKRIWEILEPAQEGDTVSKVCDIILIGLITANVLLSVVGTVHWIGQRWEWELYIFEWISITIFTVEYVGRIWSCPTDPRYASPFWGRLHFALTPLALVDLAAIVPFFLAPPTVDLRMMRLLRFVRLMRLWRLARYTAAADIFTAVFREKKEEIGLVFFVMLLLVLFSAAGIYFVEHAAQPDKFPDIPTATWWAIVTLTTVGYGDVYPITNVGKVVAAIVSLLGIGMFALPAGILGAGFTEQVQRRRSKKQPRSCPHCGQPLE